MPWKERWVRDGSAPHIISLLFSMHPQHWYEFSLLEIVSVFLPCVQLLSTPELGVTGWEIAPWQFHNKGVSSSSTLVTSLIKLGRQSQDCISIPEYTRGRLCGLPFQTKIECGLDLKFYCSSLLGSQQKRMSLHVTYLHSLFATNLSNNLTLPLLSKAVQINKIL